MEAWVSHLRPGQYLVSPLCTSCLGEIAQLLLVTLEDTIVQKVTKLPKSELAQSTSLTKLQILSLDRSQLCRIDYAA